jgi:hypothetical protein
VELSNEADELITRSTGAEDIQPTVHIPAVIAVHPVAWVRKHVHRRLDDYLQMKVKFKAQTSTGEWIEEWYGIASIVGDFETVKLGPWHGK